MNSNTREKIIVITGANRGIGLATAQWLARLGHHIVMVCRDEVRGEEARLMVESQATGSMPPALFLADLSSQHSIKRLANELNREYSRIDVLINNAAAAFAERGLTVDGIERTFAINHLAPFLLTDYLLHLLGESKEGRIVNVTAEIPWSPGRGFLENLQGQRRYQSFNAYMLSKCCNILFTYELARRLGGSGVTVNCMHPGAIATEFGARAGGMLAVLTKVLKPFLKAPEVGARTAVYLADSDGVKGVTGKFFDKNKAKKTVALTYDREVARRLWAISEELTAPGSRTAFATLPGGN